MKPIKNDRQTVKDQKYHEQRRAQPSVFEIRGAFRWTRTEGIRQACYAFQNNVIS